MVSYGLLSTVEQMCKHAGIYTQAAYMIALCSKSIISENHFPPFFLRGGRGMGPTHNDTTRTRDTDTAEGR